MKLPWKFIGMSFLIGLIAGGAAGIFMGRQMHRRWMKKAPELFLKRLDGDLSLNARQHEDIGRLLRASHDKITAFHEETRRATTAAIRAQLSADQQARFDALVARHEARRKARTR